MRPPNGTASYSTPKEAGLFEHLARAPPPMAAVLVGHRYLWQNWTFVVAHTDVMIGRCGFGSAEPVHSADRTLAKAQRPTRNGCC